MRSLMQLMRKPIKTLAGMLLTGIAVSSLIICGGQSVAVKETEHLINTMFSSVALPSVNYTVDADRWALDYAENHPEVVASVKKPGLISAYIPEVIPDNYSSHMVAEGLKTNNYTWLPEDSVAQYSSSLLEITLTELYEPSTKWLYSENGAYEYVEAPQLGVSVRFTGVVENVIGLADGYPDYRGFTVSGTAKFPNIEEYESLNLAVGSRCLIYGTYLHDNDRALRCMLTEKLPELQGVLFDAFDLEKLDLWEMNGTTQTAGTYRFDGFSYDFMTWELDLMREINVKIEDESEMPNYLWELDAEGNPDAVILEYQNIVDSNGQIVSATPDEYHDRYTEPTITRLEVNVEDFLAVEENVLWREALHNIEVNSHAFPMIGVESITDIAGFIQGKADIVQGRNFTDDELQNGDRVCVMSESLARMNGLNIGDTLTVQLYENDPGVPYQINIAEGNGCVNPVACFFYQNTMDLEQQEQYTIIGFYKQDVEWDNVDNNLYSFTPNTIFVPKTAVAVKMEYSYGGLFRTFLLHNGTINEFQQAAAEAGFSSMFYFNDNNYSVMKDSLESYSNSVESIFYVCVGIYLIVILIFFFLFPIQQRRVVRMMERIGASRTRQIIHVVMNSVGIIVPGTLLGIAAGVVMWQKVQSMLMQEAYMLPVVEMNTGIILIISGLQFLFITLVTLLIAITTTRRKNLMGCV